jgi:1-acyl-sn-glycerol-3-phosphate acyltransferase
MAEPVYHPVIAFAKIVFRTLGIRFHITGTDNVPLSGGAVMAINHVGYLDFTFAGFVTRPRGRLVRFMAKSEVFDHKVSGPLMRGMKHIPVDRSAGAGSYRTAVAACRRGEIVGVFPEATISQSFDLKEFKTGAARMAMEAGVPLLPTVIWGSQRIMTKGRKRDLTRGTDVRVVIGELFWPEAGSKPVQVTRELKARMQALLVEARATYRGGPRTPEDTWWVPVSEGGTAPSLAEAEAADAQARAARAARYASRTDGSSPAK